MKNKIIVFGGSGFLGEYFCKNMLKNNQNLLTIFDIKKPNFSHKNLKFIKGNILSKELVAKAVKDKKYIFHLAGWSDLESSNDNMENVISQNVLGTINILNSCKKINIKKFIFSSSLYVFSRFGGFYKTSKQISEILIKDFCVHNKINYHILRFGSIYGPGAKKGNAIFDLVHQALKNKRINYWGDGNETRQYIHARDTAKICDYILSNKKLNNFITLSGQETIRIHDLLMIIKEIINNKLDIKCKLDKRSFSHYKNTPFTFDSEDSFEPNIGRKLIFDEYTELSEGIYEVIRHESKKYNPI